MSTQRRSVGQIITRCYTFNNNLTTLLLHLLYTGLLTNIEPSIDTLTSNMSHCFIQSCVRQLIICKYLVPIQHFTAQNRQNLNSVAILIQFSTNIINQEILSVLYRFCKEPNMPSNQQVYPKNQYSSIDDNRSYRTSVSAKSNHSHAIYDKYSNIPQSNYKKVDYTMKFNGPSYY